jgi:ABC-type uncharacterized transport system involved in gliding motility auxiliary subunit
MNTRKHVSRGGLLARIESLLMLGLMLVVAGLIAWLSTRYDLQADWTAASRHTLSEASRRLVETLEGPVTITAYASPNPAIRRPIEDLIARYRRSKPDVALEFVDPDKVPSLVRELGITFEGEMVVDYRQRTERVTRTTEEELTNALQKLARGGERFLVFVEGHGERAARGDANHDLRSFTEQIEGRGVRVQTVNLSATGQVPDNTSALVIAGPTVAWTAAEIGAVQGWVDGGGNLLWLIDDGRMAGLDPLAERLGVRVQPGMLVDPAARLLNIADASILPVADYPARAVVGQFDLISVFPTASGLEATPLEGWRSEVLMRSGEQVWSETGDVNAGVVAYDEGSDIPGPLSLGLALTRDRSTAPARLAVREAGAESPTDESPAQAADEADADAPGAASGTTTASEGPAADGADGDTAASGSTASEGPAADRVEAEDTPADAEEGTVAGTGMDTGEADAGTDAGQQRIVVIGDGDFLSNSFLGNAGNLDLGSKLVNWLTGDEQLIDVPARLARDTQLELSTYAQALIGLTALLGIPLALLVAGFGLWWRRRAAA